MRLAIAVAVAICCSASGVALAQKSTLVLATDAANKTRIGVLVGETPSDVVFRDIKDGTEVHTPKAVLKKFEKNISDDTAIRTAGLPAVIAYRVSELVGKENAVGKVAQVSQNVIYITLGTDHGLVTGQKMDVYRTKNEIRDPVTNKVLGVERPKIGLVEVTEVTEVNKEFSKVKLVSELEVALQKGDDVEPVRQKAHVAVLAFRSEQGEVTDVAEGLAEDITTQLARHGVSVLERSVLGKLITELLMQSGGLFEPEGVQKLGQLAGATWVITGKIVTKGKLGTAYARMIDVRTGKIEYAASTTLSLANANAVSGTGESATSTSTAKSTSTVKRRPVPRGAFQSDVVELTDDAPGTWGFRAARVGAAIFSDRGYVLTTLPKECVGGSMLIRDTEQAKEWLGTNRLIALKNCTVYAFMLSKQFGKEIIGDGTISKFLGEGWEEVDGNMNVNFPGGEDWRWKVVKKKVDEGNIILHLESINWGRNTVVFVFK